jgi:hypothetical protein
MTVCAQSQTEYTGNGSQVLYTFTFPYITQNDISVDIRNDVTEVWQPAVAPYTWSFANATTIEFATAPITPTKPNLSNIRIRRSTDVSPLIAQFNPGSAIRARDLNDNFEQLQLAIEENQCGVDVNVGNIDGVTVVDPQSGQILEYDQGVWVNKDWHQSNWLTTDPSDPSYILNVPDSFGITYIANRNCVDLGPVGNEQVGGFYVNTQAGIANDGWGLAADTTIRFNERLIKQADSSWATFGGEYVLKTGDNMTGDLTVSTTGDSDNQVLLDSRGAILAFRETQASTWSALSSASAIVPSGGYQILSGGNYDAGTRVPTSWINSNGSAYFQDQVGIGGTLPSSPNIELNASGSADFAGAVNSGPISVGTASSTALGVQLSNGGLVRVQRPSTASASTPVFSGFNGNTENITLTSGGSATFGGLLKVDRDASTFATFDRVGETRFAVGDAGVYVGTDVAAGGNPVTGQNITLRTDGSAKYESAIDLTPDNTGVIELRSSDATVQAGSENSNLLRLVANTTNGYTASLISVGKYEDSSAGKGELTIKVPDTSLSANLQEFKFRGDGKALLPGDVLIGGTLPSAPNTSLNANGSAEFNGNVTLPGGGGATQALQKQEIESLIAAGGGGGGSGSGADAWGSVASDGTLENGLNIASTSRTSVGAYQVTFSTPMPSDNYSITVGGDTSLIAVNDDSKTVNGFTVSTAVDPATLGDKQFSFAIFATNAAPPKGGTGTDSWGAVKADGTLEASFNVASVTRSSTGTYDVVFATPMPNANYSVVTSAETDPIRSPVVAGARNKSVTGFTIGLGYTVIPGDAQEPFDQAFSFAVNATNATLPATLTQDMIVLKAGDTMTGDLEIDDADIILYDSGGGPQVSFQGAAGTGFFTGNLSCGRLTFPGVSNGFAWDWTPDSGGRLLQYVDNTPIGYLTYSTNNNIVLSWSTASQVLATIDGTTSVLLGTASDYRLKENDRDCEYGTDAVKALRP